MCRCPDLQTPRNLVARFQNMPVDFIQGVSFYEHICGERREGTLWEDRVHKGMGCIVSHADVQTASNSSCTIEIN